MRARFGGTARGAGLVLSGLLVGLLLISPATAHFTQNTRHLGQHAWKEVIRQKVYTKKQSNNRFLRKDLEVVQANSAYNSTAVKGITASCPPGKIAISGGGGLRKEGLFDVDPADLALQDLVPSPSSGVPTGYTATGVESESTTDNWRVSAFAVCVSG